MTNTARTRTVLGATVAGVAIAVALVAGPFRSDVSGNAHHLDACLTGANPTACHG
jgi:poly-gamma-glutamate capsule biosynthesis protein CapA/YwtB (metallophosphatase superfamily)